jgi:predicted RNase H-like nuclease (RuvC/YqgF family)
MNIKPMPEEEQKAREQVYVYDEANKILSMEIAKAVVTERAKFLAAERMIEERNQAIIALNEQLDECKHGVKMFEGNKIADDKLIEELRTNIGQYALRLEKAQQQIVELEQKLTVVKDGENFSKRLDSGRNYLMGVYPRDFSVEDCLEAFGYTRNGFEPPPPGEEGVMQ